jgi:hypothetical protein
MFNLEAMGIGGWKLVKEEKYMGVAMDLALAANIWHGEHVRVVDTETGRVCCEYGGKRK